MQNHTGIHAFANDTEIHFSDRFNHNTAHELTHKVFDRKGALLQEWSRTYPTRLAAWTRLYEEIAETMDDETNLTMSWGHGQLMFRFPNGNRYFIYVSAI